jgi:ATP-dependent Zn protease
MKKNLREFINNVRPSNIVWHMEDGVIGTFMLLRNIARGVRIEYQARQLADAEALAHKVARAPIDELREITERTDQLIAARRTKYKVHVPADKEQTNNPQTTSAGGLQS